jgi:hypothetical protein
MRERIRHMARRATVGLVVGLGLSVTATAPTAGLANPAPGSGRQVVVTRLPMPEGTDRGTASDINNHGLVVGQVSTLENGRPRGRPVLWDRGRMVELAGDPETGRGAARFVNDRGEVALRIDGHAAIWHRGRVTDIDGDAVSSDVHALSEGGDAIVSLTPAGGSETLALWRDGALVHFASPLGPDVSAYPMALGDRGHVGVESRAPGCRPEPCPAHLWYRGTYVEFPAGQFSVGMSDIVNRSGHVLGMLGEGDGDDLTWRGAIRSPRSELLSTFTCPAGAARPQPSPEALNDRGQVAGHCVVADGEDLRSRVVLWDRGQPRWLPSLGGATYLEALNERGEIIGESDNHEVLWSRGELFDLGYYLDGASARALNDRGQVAGHLEPQPVVWHLR